MTRQEYVLAVLAAGKGQPHEVVHVQKLFFLLDRKVPREVGGPWFNFEPAAYGPFDEAVSEELRALAKKGLVTITTEHGLPQYYFPTPIGFEEGEKHLAKLPPPIAQYIGELSFWVRRQSFWHLVASIYAEFPEMKVRGVFVQGTP
jgi:hypothetical protein